jgi:putative colanic acid biosynthesis glycosyltransferase WcaI
MRVLIATQYFTPEIHAPPARLHAFAEGLTARGHEVEVICAIPNHPTGTVAPGYGGHLVDRRWIDGFAASYVWVYATPSRSMRARLANYASYAATAALAGLITRQVDVILASSPPLSVGSVGALLALRHRAPWVLDVRDLWPDAAVALDQIEDGAMLRLAQRLERRLYRSASAVTVTTEPWKRAIEGRGGAGKTTVIPNGTTEDFMRAGMEAREPSLLDAGGRFTWTYAGNLGLVSGLETALEAARELGDDFQLLIVGAGPRREEFQRLASELPPGAVVFRDPVPREEAARLLRASDALLVSRGPAPGLDGIVLAKLYDYCAVGRPIVVAAAGETSRIAAEAEAALCIPPADPAELASAVRRLRDDRTLGERLAERARAFAKSNSRERGAAVLDSVLTEVAARTGAPS